MAARKNHHERPSYLYLGGETLNPISSETHFDFDETELWNSIEPKNSISIPNSRASKKAARRISDSIDRRPKTGTSLPVNIPDWSKILRGEYKNDYVWSDENNDDDDDDDRIPPHEYLARTRIASFSVHEGVGRTLKGRDLSRVRNAIWKQTGFED